MGRSIQMIHIGRMHKTICNLNPQPEFNHRHMVILVIGPVHRVMAMSRHAIMLEEISHWGGMIRIKIIAIIIARAMVEIIARVRG